MSKLTAKGVTDELPTVCQFEVPVGAVWSVTCAAPLAAWVSVQHDRALLDLDAPALVAPGQAAVLYDGDEVVGGGIVDRTKAPRREATPLSE